MKKIFIVLVVATIVTGISILSLRCDAFGAKEDGHTYTTVKATLEVKTLD